MRITKQRGTGEPIIKMVSGKEAEKMKLTKEKRKWPTLPFISHR